MNWMNWALLTLPLFGLGFLLLGIKCHDKMRPLARQKSK